MRRDTHSTADGIRQCLLAVMLTSVWVVLPEIHRLSHEHQDLDFHLGGCPAACATRGATGDVPENSPPPESGDDTGSCPICKIFMLGVDVPPARPVTVTAGRTVEQIPFSYGPVRVLHRMAPMSRGPPTA